MEIEGMYTEFGLFETSLLGLLCQGCPRGVATKAAPMQKGPVTEGDQFWCKTGSIQYCSPMVERNAFIGGT